MEGGRLNFCWERKLYAGVDKENAQYWSIRRILCASLGAHSVSKRDDYLRIVKITEGVIRSVKEEQRWRKKKQILWKLGLV